MGGRLPMLRSRHDFAELGASGRSRTHRLLVVRSRPNDLGHDRFGISTGRRLGGAVVRNRVRRRIREAIGHLSTATGDGRDILIVARPASADASYQDLRVTLETLVGPVRTQEGATRA